METGKTLTIGAVIPTSGRRQRLPRVLEPLLDDPVLAEIVVVVDGRDDGSIELLTELARSEPRLRALWIERGGANAARFAGARHSSSDVILLLDDDVLAAPDLAAGHLVHHTRAKGLVVAGYLEVREEPWRPGAAVREAYRRAYERQCRAWQRNPSELLRGLWAGNLSLRRRDLLRLASQSPMPGGYHADRDLGLRCLRMGMIGVFDRGLRARHEYSRSLRDFAADAESSGATGAKIYEMHRDLVDAPRLLPRSRASRWLVNATRWPPVAALLVWAAVCTARIAIFLRWRLLEERAVKVLGLVARRRGAATAAVSGTRVP